MDNKIARKLHDVFEPIAGNCYFAPQVQSKYREIGLSYLPGYFVSRSAAMGILSGTAVSSIFAVFNPDIVIPSVEEGWKVTSRESVLAARLDGATESLSEHLTETPEGAQRAIEIIQSGIENARFEGHPIFAGLMSLDFPDNLVGQLFRSCDLIREHRGDSHTLAWTSKGVDAIEISILSEGFQNIPLKTYAFTRGWSGDQLDETIERLKSKGLVTSENKLTDKGLALREDIESLTDSMELPILKPIEDTLEELIGILAPMSRKILENGGYPKSATNFMEIISKNI